MPLAKQFLHEPNPFKQIPKLRFWGGIMVAFLFSICFYSFMIAIREMYRAISITPQYELWVLSKEAIRFNNTFFAFVSLIASQSFLFAFWFDKGRKAFSKRNFRFKTLVNDQRVLNWAFIHWFAHFSMVIIGVCVHYYYFTSPNNDLLPEFNYAFVLLLMVLFLHPWLGISRIYKKRTYRWMLISAIVVSILSFILSMFSPVNPQDLTDKVHSKNISRTYNIELPVLEHYSEANFDNACYELYVMYGSNDSTILFGLWNNIDTIKAYQHDLREALHHTLNNCYYARNWCKLYMDKDIPMKTMNIVRYYLKIYGSRHISYAFEQTNNDSNYKRFYRYSQKLYNTVETYDYELIFPKKNVPPPPPSYLKRVTGNELIKNGYQLLQVRLIEKGKVIIHNDTISVSDTYTYFKKAFSSPSKLLLDLQYEDNTTYGDYLEVNISYRVFREEQRDNYCINKYGKTYNELFYIDTVNLEPIDRMFTIGILELNDLLE